MAYEESDIRSKCIEAMKDPKDFYKKDFVNYRGKFPNTGVYFNEAVAEFVIAHFDELVRGIHGRPPTRLPGTMVIMIPLQTALRNKSQWICSGREISILSER